MLPHLFYSREALESKSRTGPRGSAKMVNSALFGRRCQVISAGTHLPFDDAIPMIVLGEDQDEPDRCWSALLEKGAEERTHT